MSKTDKSWGVAEYNLNIHFIFKATSPLSERERGRDGKSICICDSRGWGCCWICSSWILQERNLTWRPLRHLWRTSNSSSFFFPLLFHQELVLIHTLLFSYYFIDFKFLYSPGFLILIFFFFFCMKKIQALVLGTSEKLECN